MIVSEQLNYTKTRWFHAIFMPVIIEFSRCIGIYSSAKFEYIIFSVPFLIFRKKIPTIVINGWYSYDSSLLKIKVNVFASSVNASIECIIWKILGTIPVKIIIPLLYVVNIENVR